MNIVYEYKQSIFIVLNNNQILFSDPSWKICQDFIDSNK
jgi:hypothetical protein